MLTPAQSETLQFVQQFQAERNGISPSYQEIADALGLSGKAPVKRRLDALEKRQFIRRVPGRQRAIVVLASPALAQVSTEALRAELARRGAV
jgi:repressor LexA